ncbi:DUF805 domain-containing protein [Allisonella histaminiformans]|uniref:DUF805 domain-containing protein n=1 Tax=Allisonella histaminiformans TaxID=209880 RepID=UPI00352097AD
MINRYRKLISRHPFLLTWFSFDGRVNRRQYLFRSLALGAVWLLTIAIAWYGTNALFNMKLDILGYILTAVFILAALLVVIADNSLMARRLHDMGYTAAPIMCLIYGITFVSPAIDRLLGGSGWVNSAVSVFNLAVTCYLFLGKGEDKR